MSAPIPRRMPSALADLRRACDALKPQRSNELDPSGHLACPIFGNSIPLPAPSPAGLPPMLALASAELVRVIRSSGQLASPRRVVCKGGRPREITVAQVKRLAHGLGAGLSITGSARHAGMSKATSVRILSGRHWMSDHPLIAPLVAASVASIEARRHVEAVQNPTKNPPSPDRVRAGGVVATAGSEAAVTAAESTAA